MSRTRTTITSLLGAVLLAGLLAAPAAAHVTANPDEVHSPFFKVDFRVGHGCEGSPTTAVRVQIPDGLESPRPEVAPGWDIEIAREDATEPEDQGRVTEVAWVGGSLPDEHVQEFGLSGRFTDEAGDVVYFPFVQECTEGEHRWIDIPASLEEWDELEEPAPYVRLAFRDAADAGAAADPADGDPAQGDQATEGAAGDGGTATDPLAVAGLVAGLLGLAAGGLALARTGGR